MVAVGIEQRKRTRRAVRQLPPAVSATPAVITQEMLFPPPQTPQGNLSRMSRKCVLDGTKAGHGGESGNAWGTAYKMPTISVCASLICWLWLLRFWR
jgi:hypothetical protein